MLKRRSGGEQFATPHFAVSFCQKMANHLHQPVTSMGARSYTFSSHLN